MTRGHNVSRIVTAMAVAFFLTTLFVSTSSAVENKNPRFGKWKLKSDNPPPFLNIMTYEPYEENGMRITVEATNSEGQTRKWSYVTLFDGKYRPVTGDTRTEETAVEIVDERTNKIMNRTGDRVNIITNVLSEDGNTINNEYRSIDDDGNERVTHAVYERIQ
jgi:hypothetical protein